MSGSSKGRGKAPKASHGKPIGSAPAPHEQNLQHEEEGAEGAWASWTPGTVDWRGGSSKQSWWQTDSWASHHWSDSSWAAWQQADHWESSRWQEATATDGTSRSGNRAASTSSVQNAQTRQELMHSLFQLFDQDGDGSLGREEMRRFSEQNGFPGNEEEWLSEYRSLCAQLGCKQAVGISKEAFCRLLDDTSDEGCYLDDAELRDQVQGLQGAAERGSEADAIEPEVAAARVDGNNSDAAGPEDDGRDARKKAIFRKLDLDGDGFLGLMELRPFVEKTGFEGSDADWKKEYTLLCKDLNCFPSRGLSLEDFSTLLDDETESGCFVPDCELRTLTSSWDWLPKKEPEEEPPRGVGKEAMPAAQVVKTARPPVPKAPPPGISYEANKKVVSDSDPWEASFDPWSAPSAQKKHQQQMAEEAKRQAGANEKWKEFQENASKPALNVQKLLEASRAANAARKAKEEASSTEALPSVPPPAHVQPRTKPLPVPSQDAADEDGEEGQEDSNSEEKPITAEQAAERPGERDDHGLHASTRAQVRRSADGAESLALIRDGVVRASLGDRAAIKDLADAVVGSPSVAHSLAVASSVIRALLLDKTLEAQMLLQVDEILLDFIDGIAALLSTLAQLARRLGAVSSPFLQRALVAALSRVDDKHDAVRSAAIIATEEIIKNCDVYAFECLVPALLAGLDAKRTPGMKLHALRLLSLACRGDAQRCVAHRLPVLLPAAIALLSEVSSDIKAAANNVVSSLCALSGNRDLQPHHETVIGCACASRDVAKCVREMAEVVFVQEVEAPALAVMMPVLTRGLKSRASRTQRQATVICENMCRLLPSVADVQHFTSQLLPLLQRISQDAADPEVREVAGKAEASLSQVANEDVTGTVRLDLKTAMLVAVSCAETSTESGGEARATCPAPVRDVIMDFVVMQCVGMARCGIRKVDWKQHLLPHLLPLVGHELVDNLVTELHDKAQRLETEEARRQTKADDVDDDSDVDVAPDRVLCDCTTMLARGAATLLSGARLRLLRGSVYGLVGGNDSGKSFLLRAIHERKVSGFPTVAEITSALVEHGVGERQPESDMTPEEYLAADPALRGKGLSDVEIKDALKELGFSEGAKLKMPIRALSGGWRMKLGLARALLQEADLLLLDEPTGHLDASNTSWLEEYLQRLKSCGGDGVTVVTVSHDTSFLDKVCTHIIHVQNQSLQTYKGDFSSFVARVPDAQLGATATQEAVAAFQLPEPGPLEGVKSQGRRFLHLDGATYSYPGSMNTVAVKNITAELSLRSRVAIVGPNGAGKSTLAGLIVGELAPDAGTCWRHPNLRVAYVAQHAFHHLEKHVDISATEYILWRFQGNEDREALDARAEEAEMDELRTYRFQGDSLTACDSDDPDIAVPEVVLDRRQRGRLGFEYEVRWRGTGHASWVSRSQLARMGHLGMAKREDERQAAQRSLATRPLTTPSVEAHLAGFGLSAEEATHRRIGRLSNGQMARTVLAAATWLAPHLLVLDEPTNYLDGPALAALGAGLRGFGGGVVVISHNPILLNEVCVERWLMSKGALQHEDGPATKLEEVSAQEAERSSLASGKLLEAKEKKKQRRMKDLRRKQGEEVSDDEDWWSDLLQKANSKSGVKR